MPGCLFLGLSAEPVFLCLFYSRCHISTNQCLSVMVDMKMRMALVVLVAVVGWQCAISTPFPLSTTRGVNCIGASRKTQVSAASVFLPSSGGWHFFFFSFLCRSALPTPSLSLFLSSCWWCGGRGCEWVHWAKCKPSPSPFLHGQRRQR